ncbi:fasciclin domain-containing protein [Parabacteroides sp. FAFU027]|uniref:fasciclin domain-containing protein n=1 Tax=Parabacteroides sp. FAFU027 TaxID=2922715 RepID=UPI001FAFC4E1|nr:fasciclin domain-containing protein [Parabacteroides sp. FAFU027]
MKRNILKTAFYNKLIVGIALAILSNLLFTACYNSDDVGGNLYTFTDKNVGEYLRNNPAQYSEFTRLLDTTGVIGLLDAYGTYSCFAPNNKAMAAFYKKKGKAKLSDFTLDSLKLIAYDHIVSGDTVLSRSFLNGQRLSQLSMSDRYFSIRISGDTTFLNNTSQIIEKDIRLHNGVVFQIGEVLNPTRFGLASVVAQDQTFSLFNEALVATGLADSLLKDKDPNYNATAYKSLESEGSWTILKVPASRKYGYTLLMESNTTMNANGITDLASMKAYAASVYDQVYPEDANISDIHDRRNSLNRFIAYHIIEKQLNVAKLIDAYDTGHMLKTIDMFEYLETMCPNTLIEVSKIRSTNKTNQLNRMPETGLAVNVVTSNSDKDASNGVYHEIDKMLVYSQDVDAMLSSKRLRFDVASFFNEFANNNMRGLGSTKYDQKNLQFYIPRGYLDRLTWSEQTTINYLTAFDAFLDYEGDEIFLSAANGKLYDFTVTTPPIPAGTYEVRFGYLTNGQRGVAQFYVDGTPAGLPLNLNNSATNSAIGYQTIGSVAEDPYGYQNDKMMRNRGYMKGPAGYTAPDLRWQTVGPARKNANSLRRILGTYTFTSAGKHQLTVKGLSNGEFMFDFLEFVPTSAIETEDIY